MPKKYGVVPKMTNMRYASQKSNCLRENQRKRVECKTGALYFTVWAKDQVGLLGALLKTNDDLLYVLKPNEL